VGADYQFAGAWSLGARFVDRSLKRVIEDFGIFTEPDPEPVLQDADPVLCAAADGSAWFRAGSLEEAERWYEEALEANPRLGEAHSNLAVVCLRTDRIEEAWNHVKAAEKAGFRVHPQLKKDVESRRRGKR
jgi:tetratricopeptide (TPR) repeat protein